MVDPNASRFSVASSTLSSESLFERPAATPPSTKQRRLALKQFYKQVHTQPAEPVRAPVTEPAEQQVPATNYEQIANDFETLVQTSPLSRLLAVHNEVTSSLNGNQSEIKSIVYNNYYDLIKLNEFLSGQEDGGEAFDMTFLAELEAVAREIKEITPLLGS